jgi:hypothetical protein
LEELSIRNIPVISTAQTTSTTEQVQKLIAIADFELRKVWIEKANPHISQIARMF